MARNSEKAQSMLYRFRETQAAELGLQNRVKGARRPRMASSVTSLRQCEMWRADILKEVSRKVSKIQDATLTDYEVRDLNDEINGLMREKRHWETQIVNLGGANYKRGQQAMLDDAGREVPGTRGYKYFGRAKELPGVKEMFTRGVKEANEESARNAAYQAFRNQGPAYYGDIDEVDPGLLEEEDAAAREDWDRAVAEAAALLLIDTSEGVLPYPASSSKPPAPAPAVGAEAAAEVAEKPEAKKGQKGAKGKRKTQAEEASVDGEVDAEEDGDGEAKKAKTTDGAAEPPVNGSAAPAPTIDPQQAAMVASFLGVLDADSLKAPTLPTADEMGKVLLEVRKKALRDEYGV